MVISYFRECSGGLGGVFSSKLAPVDCKTDRENKIEGDLSEDGVKFPQQMAPNGLRENWKLFINMPGWGWHVYLHFFLFSEFFHFFRDIYIYIYIYVHM